MPGKFPGSAVKVGVAMEERLVKRRVDAAVGPYSRFAATERQAGAAWGRLNAKRVVPTSGAMTFKWPRR